MSLDIVVQRLNKTSATIIDTDALRVEIEQMLRKRVIDQDYKVLISITVQERTCDDISTEDINTNCTEQNSVYKLPTKY